MSKHRFFAIRFGQIASLLLLVISFQNCGQTGEIGLEANTREPAIDPGTLGSPVTDPVTLISNPSLVINEGKPFTRSINVQLNSYTVGAQEMLISNLPDCSSNIGWQPFSQQTAWVLSDVNKDISVYAKFRKKGAPETECVKASIRHDNQPPRVVIDQPAPKFTSLASINVGFSASDSLGSGIDKIFCKSSNGSEVECLNFFNFNALASERTYSVTVRAVDLAGNESEPVTDSFVIDRTAPAITINGPSGIVADPNLKFRISYVESNGLKYLNCRLSPLETQFKDCLSLAVEYLNRPNGIYKLDVQASDLAGNIGYSSRSVEIDSSVPSVLITKAPVELGNQKNVGFEFSGTSGARAISKFSCYLQNGNQVGNPVSCASPTSYKDLPDNQYIFNVVGTNQANISSTPQTYKFIVDTVPPVIDIVSAPSARTKMRTATIVLNANDLNGIKSIQCSLNGVVTNCSNKTITYTDLPDQNDKYTFYAMATDGAGNSTVTAPYSWVIDNTFDSSILASMKQNPVKENMIGTLNILLTQVYQPKYNCIKISDKVSVASGLLTADKTDIDFKVSEDILCDVSGLDKLGAPIKVSVKADVSCGNKIKQDGKCIDFKCLSVVELPYSKVLNIPVRSGDGVCYAMKIFNAIPNSSSSLTKILDTEIVSRNHDAGGGNRNPYSMNKDLLNFVLGGPRVVKLSGGVSATQQVLIDNFAVIGLYPKAIAPIAAHFQGFGTADSVPNGGSLSSMTYKTTPINFKPFGPSGTATITPLEIVREADTNLNYILDIRALDCGSVRQLSNIYVLFQ